METSQSFVRDLQEALEHLYDPGYRPPDTLWRAMGCEPRSGMKTLQAALIQEIEGLKPGPNVPTNARSWRVYGLLSGIYVQGLTQEDAAERLDITPRHLRRERPEAIHALALRLWEQRQAEVAVPEAQAPAPPPDAQAPTWRTQMRQELASLQQGAPGTTADVGESIRSSIKLAHALIKERAIDLQTGRLQPGLVVEVHRSALLQDLIAATGQLIQHMSSGRITFSAERAERNARITIEGHPIATAGALDSVFIQEMIAAQGGSLATRVDGVVVSFQIELPAVTHTVLVVDDNKDIAHLYRRYALGTSYHIVDIAQGQKVFEWVETLAPDIIVLDVMLPDVDGWELLSHLREHAVAQSIPILVCSVVREQDLALALGADRYLVKPIQRQQFVDALDQLLSQAVASRQIPSVRDPISC
jgi:CheY-like chemotaxis protein